MSDHENLLRRLHLADTARRNTNGFTWSKFFWTRVTKTLERKVKQQLQLINS